MDIALHDLQHRWLEEDLQARVVEGCNNCYGAHSVKFVEVACATNGYYIEVENYVNLVCKLDIMVGMV